MYEQYLKYNHIPAGAVLKRILDREHISQRKLAEMSGLLPQHINAYIKGTRRFSPKTSMQIEAHLNLEKPGYFFLYKVITTFISCFKSNTGKPTGYCKIISVQICFGILVLIVLMPNEMPTG